MDDYFQKQYFVSFPDFSLARRIAAHMREGPFSRPMKWTKWTRLRKDAALNYTNTL